MRRFLLLTCVSLFIVHLAFAQPIGKGIVEVTEEDLSPSCFGYQIKFANTNVTDNGDGTCSVADQTGAGVSGWTDDGGEVRLDTAGDEVEIGSAGTLSAKFAVNGDADEVQMLIQGNATQSANVLVIEQSNGTDIMTVNTTGVMISKKLTVAGTSDDIELIIRGNSTQTSNIFVIEKSDGIDVMTGSTTGVKISSNLEIGDPNGSAIRLFFDLSGDDGYIEYQSGEFRFSTIFKPFVDSAPTTSSTGHTAFDSNAWASGHGAYQVYDGTSSTWLLGVLSSETCNDGQTVKINAGIWTCENDNNSGGITGSNTQVLFFDGVDNPSGSSLFTFNKTTGTVSATAFQAAASSNPTIDSTDSDTVDDDVSTRISTNCTHIGSNNENCDMSLSQQSAGVMTPRIVLDADGGILMTGSTVGVTGDVTITGNANEVQLNITGNATQTANLFVIERSGGVDVMTGNTAGIRVNQNFAVAGSVKFDGLTSCDTVDTDAGGYLKCGTDATGVGGGDAITVNSSAATDPDFLDGDIDWTLTGGNSITATVGCSGCIGAGEIVTDALTTTQMAATLTFADADLLDFGTNISAVNEGILIPANATTCASATSEGQLCWEEDADNLWIGDGVAAKQMNGAAGGAPTDADYLVGTANGTLSAEIVVGTTPGGELGNTWASPTLDDSVTVTGWVMGASTATTPAADDNDTSLATTAYVQTELISTKEMWWPATSLLPLEPAESIPPIAKDAGTNIDQLTVDFDATTDECRTVSFKVPANITAGTVTFYASYYMGSVTSGTVLFEFRHNSGVADGVDPDVALTVESDVASTVPGTAGMQQLATWTETIANLAWAANDMVDGEVCRDPDADSAAGDAKLKGFGINMPVAL